LIDESLVQRLGDGLRPVSSRLSRAIWVPSRRAVVLNALLRFRDLSLGRLKVLPHLNNFLGNAEKCVIAVELNQFVHLWLCPFCTDYPALFPRSSDSLRSPEFETP
jgi:hypothetical protein